MDNLARDMMLAKQDGMSYGRWKVMHPNTKPTGEQKIANGWRNCEFCGKPFKRSQGKRFCDIECRNEAYLSKKRANQREYMKKHREAKKAVGGVIG